MNLVIIGTIGSVLLSVQAQAQNPNKMHPSIVDVRRNITLSNDEKPYKDFYIDLGSNPPSLKENQIVKAVRTLTVRDSSGAQSYGEVRIPIAKLKIIAVYDRVAIAREEETLSREKIPMLEYLFVMSGDEIEVN